MVVVIHGLKIEQQGWPALIFQAGSRKDGPLQAMRPSVFKDITRRTGFFRGVVIAFIQELLDSKGCVKAI